MNRRNFMRMAGLAVGGSALNGCRHLFESGGEPILRFGVISDIHIQTPESTERFRRALRYFDRRGADAVMVAGDLSDWGLKSGFKYVADAWNSVFPCDRAEDGRHVSKLYVTGNHDFDGWWYGDMTLDMHLNGYSEDEALSRIGMKACWESAFGEPYAMIRKRMVRGVVFVNADRRNGRWTIFVELGLPAAECREGRVFDYLVAVQFEDGRVAAEKKYLSPAFYRLERDEPPSLAFRFDGMDLPESGRYRFAVYPRNCFGGAGKPICSRWFESKPGKDATKYKKWS